MFTSKTAIGTVVGIVAYFLVSFAIRLFMPSMPLWASFLLQVLAAALVIIFVWAVTKRTVE